MFIDNKKDENIRYEDDMNNVSTHKNETPPDWDDVPAFDSGAEQDTTLANTYEGESAYETDDPVITSQDDVNDNSAISSIPQRHTANGEVPSFLNVRSRDIKKSLLSVSFFDTRKSKVIVISAIFVFVAGIFSLTSGDNTQPETTTIAVVLPADVIKEAPVDPKGMEIEHLDKVVYGAVNDVDKQEEETVEKLLPKIEKPIVIESAKGDIAIITPKKVVIKPTKIVRKKAVKKKVKKTAVNVVKNSGKSWIVQLSSIGANASAKKEYAKYFKKYSALKGSKLFVELVVIKGKTYQRVQAIGYKTKSLATSACKSIIAQGGQCLVKKR